MEKILVVDDDEGILDAVSIILETEGFVVEVADKDEEVYKKVKSFNPDLILLDVRMSGSDGREICKKLKSNPEVSGIPIVMMSAHPTAKQGALDFGANDFLEKPFSGKDLIGMIRNYL
jgi:DNA-binding response OmpR family regulator